MSFVTGTHTGAFKRGADRRIALLNEIAKA